MYEEQFAAEADDQILPPEEYEQLAGTAMEVQVSEAHVTRWRRPPVPQIDTKADAITLQWLDVDMTVGKRLQYNPAGHHLPVPGASSGVVPIIRFYGVTPNGNSAAVFVHGFTPYLYVSCPPNFIGARSQVRKALNDRLQSDKSNRRQEAEMAKLNGELCLGVEIEQDKRSILGYQSGTSTAAFFKIYVATPNFVNSVKRILDDGLDVPGYGRLQNLLTYESNVPFVLRFMIDKDITGAGWLECPGGTYSIRREVGSVDHHLVFTNSVYGAGNSDHSSLHQSTQMEKESHCQLEIDIVHENLIGHKPEGQWNKLAPLRILSFDIECQVCAYGYDA